MLARLGETPARMPFGAFQPPREIQIGKYHCTHCDVNVDAGSFSLLKRFASDQLAHPYRTNLGWLTPEASTTTVEPSIFAVAGTNFPSSPAISNPAGAPWLVSPLSA